MYASQWEQELLCYRLRSARSRKRTAETAREKQLRRLYNQERTIDKTIRDLPWIPLEQPYQKYRSCSPDKDPRFINPYKQKPVHLILQETGNEKEESWTR